MNRISGRQKSGISQSRLPLHMMMLLPAAFIIVFNYFPMFGVVMAFQRYVPARGIFGSDWVGFGNFSYIFRLPGFRVILFNTFYIAVLKIITGTAAAILVALMLNEIYSPLIKRTIQTVIYLPHFLSWVILGGILVDVLSPSSGIINQLMSAAGIKPVFFLGDPKVFPYTLIATDIWKDVGFRSIVYISALTGINPELYEAAIVDGANRWKQTLHITLPGIMPIIILLATLSLGNVLNAGFDQVFNLYSIAVYSTGDIIDTYTYRMGLISLQFSRATTIGLFKSVISFTLIAVSYKIAIKYANYRIF